MKPERFARIFNGVCGNNRDASVYGDDAKSKNPGRLGRVSGQGIHYVRPSNFGRMIALVVVTVAVGTAIPLERNKAAKE